VISLHVAHNPGGGRLHVTNPVDWEFAERIAVRIATRGEVVDEYALTRMAASARKFDLASVKAGELALVAAVAPDEE